MGKKKIQSLQALRALAFIGIFLNHAGSDMIPSSRTLKYKNLPGGVLCPEKVKLMQ